MARAEEMTRRRCNNPRCGRWYDVPARLVRQGKGLYCHRQCGWNALRKGKWYKCQNPNLERAEHMFWRSKSRARGRKPKYCSQECYHEARRMAKTVAKWADYDARFIRGEV